MGGWRWGEFGEMEGREAGGQGFAGSLARESFCCRFCARARSKVLEEHERRRGWMGPDVARRGQHHACDDHNSPAGNRSSPNCVVSVIPVRNCPLAQSPNLLL